MEQYHSDGVGPQRTAELAGMDLAELVAYCDAIWEIVLPDLAEALIRYRRETDRRSIGGPQRRPSE
jgi:hypothetical protein